MKASVIQSKLAQALMTVSRTVNARNTLPILSYILLKAEKGRIKVSATNLEIGVNVYLGGKIDESGEISVPAKLFTEFVSSLSDEKITLALKEQNLNVKSESVESNFNCLSAEEFPLIPDIKGTASAKIGGAEFREAIGLVSFAAATDETRPVLSGILLKSADSTLILAATDSYRLAEKVVKLSKKPAKEMEAIVPAKTLIELSRILADYEGEVEIFLNENQVGFKVGDVELISRLIDGQFPNYVQIIPDETQTKSEVKTSEFIQSLKVAYLFARESANTIKITFNPKGELVLHSSAASVGDNVTKIKAKVSGIEGEISFNVRYLLDVLGALKDDTVKLEISGKLNPGVVKPTKTSDYIYILMPLKV